VAEGAKVDPAAHLTGPVMVGVGAVVEAGAKVGPEAVIGAGCRVGQGAVVERAVVWAGTSVAPGERLSLAIAAGEHRVPAGS
jgi:mannose-1-phosphate guanylyltransferase